MNNVIINAGHKVAVKVAKHSPALLLGVGIAGFVGTVILACKETKKAQEVIEEAHKELDAIDLKVQPKKIDYIRTYTKTGAKLVRVYAPSILLGSISVSCLVGSHHILNKRYVGTAAAYTILDESFDRYRDKIRAMLGDEVEKNIYLNMEPKEDIPVKDIDPDTGEVIISPTKGVIVNPDLGCSPYAIFFDESCGAWQKNAEYNKLTLTNYQNWANDILKAKGHLFLNEVYDMLGVPRTSAGQVVGWLKDGDGDGYVDFGIYNAFSEKARDFVNGYERSILLDFNVDGLIWDKI